MNECMGIWGTTEKIRMLRELRILDYIMELLPIVLMWWWNLGYVEENLYF